MTVLVRAGANLIKSVLMNLLDNACKASEPEGHIEAQGHLNVKDDTDSEVKDHGVGIPEGVKRLPRRVYMVDKSRSRSQRRRLGPGFAAQRF